MRSSSIESNNTTIYTRPILCNSQEQLGELSFFSLFEKWLYVLRGQQLATQDTEMHFARLEKKNKTKTKILEKKTSNNMVVCKLKTCKPQWDDNRNKPQNTV